MIGGNAIYKCHQHTWPDLSLVIGDAISLLDPYVHVVAAIERRVVTDRLLIADAGIEDDDEPAKTTSLLGMTSQ